MTQLPLFEAPTDKQRRAIAILQVNPGLEPLPFARLMWPESKGWAQKGGRFHWSMDRVALGMLGSLRKAGFVFVLNEKWYVAANIDYVTLAPKVLVPDENPETPF